MVVSNRCRSVFVCVAIACLVALPAAAAPRIATLSVGGASLDWAPQGSFQSMKLTVSGPSGVFEHSFAAGQSPSFSIFDKAGQRLADGVYNWELSGAPRLDAAVKRQLNQARRNGDQAAIARLRQQGLLPEGGVMSGTFTITNGSFVADEGQPEQAPRATAAARITAADQVIPDDLIVQQSLCVGFDCVNNESFGFDTIRLKENNTRIKFEDTSTGTFPTNDWQLTANDSASGGSSKFSIEDITGAKVPFTITAGASTNSIFVDSTGRVGLRTSTPVLDLHINTSNTPAIRLEQNNSGGFTAQTWDIGANEANFFVRDVTGGSKLSLRIRPGAPTSSVDISADGDVGVGTGSPDEKLHVLESVDAATIGLVNNTSTGTSAVAVWQAKNDSGLVTSFAAQGSARSGTRYGASLAGRSEVLSAGGNGLLIGTLEADDVIFGTNNANRMSINGSTGAVTIAGNLTVNGTFSNPSSRALKQNFVRVDPNAVLEKLAQVPVQEWTYKSDERQLRHVGPTVEDFRDVFGLGTDGQYMFPIDVQGVTMAAVQGLYHRLLEKDAQITELQRQLEEIKEQMERVQP